MIKPTLEHPDIVLEEHDPKEGADRDTKYLFVKTFVKEDGGRTVHFANVTVRQGAMEVSISSHEISPKHLAKKMQNDKVLHLNERLLNSEGRLIEPQGEGPDLVPTPSRMTSERKNSDSAPIEQTPTGGSPLPRQRGAVSAAEDVATPTVTTIEAQQSDEQTGHAEGQSKGAEATEAGTPDVGVASGSKANATAPKKQAQEKKSSQAPVTTLTDKQGNPVDETGALLVEKVASIEGLTDDDFTNPTRNVELPTLPPNVADAIGTGGRPVVIKKNVFEKNRDSHKELTPEQSRDILNEALYNASLYGQNQKATRPYNWILVHTGAGKNSAIILEVNSTKDNVEIVNWHYLNADALERKKRQAEREGGLILNLSEDKSTANVPDGKSSAGKDTPTAATAQVPAEAMRPAARAVAEMARSLGREVVFEGDFPGPHVRRYVGRDGVLHINPNMRRPQQMAVVIGHEFVHTLEGTKQYEDMVRFLRGSSLMSIDPEAVGGTSEQQALGNALVSVMRDAGIEVVTDAREMARVLGLDGKAQQQARLSMLKKAEAFIREGLGKGRRGGSFTIELPATVSRIINARIREVQGRRTAPVEWSHEISISGIRHGLNNHGLSAKIVHNLAATH